MSLLSPSERQWMLRNLKKGPARVGREELARYTEHLAEVAHQPAALFANSLAYWSQFATDAQTSKRRWKGLIIIIETPRYDVREGDGWMSSSPAHYGHIAGTKGADGEEVDCYFGPNPRSSRVYIVDQNKIGSKEFDEHKVMLAYRTRRDAKRDYMDGHTHSEQIFRRISRVTLEELKKWLAEGDTTQPYRS